MSLPIFNDVPHAVTGVAAFRGVNVVSPAVIWAPLQPAERVRLIGRLGEGVSIAQGARVLTEMLPDPRRTSAVRVGPERAMLIAPASPRIVSIATAIAAVLALGVVLVAAANVIGVLVARVTLRRGELSVRAALGASRTRIARQMIVETLPLAVPSALVAYLVAVLGSRGLTAVLPPMLTAAIDFTPGLRVLSFAGLLSMLATFFAGAAAAFQARRTTAAELGVRGVAAGTPVVLRAIVVVQLACTAVVLLATGLLLQTARVYRAIDPRFESDRQLTVSFDGGMLQASRVRELADLVRGVNGVTHVGIARNTPMARQASATVRVVDATREGHVSQIEDEFFASAGIPILRGRSVGRGDVGMAVVNEATGVDVGQSVFVDDHEHRVVGVVRDARMSSLAEPPRPYVWLPWDERSPMRLQVRAARDLGAVTRDVNALFRNAGVAVTVSRLREVVDADRLLAETAFVLAAVLGALTLFLAAVGLFGVVTTIVANRRRELAVRVALGATPFAIARLVASGTARILITGLILGGLLAVPTSRALASLLFGVSAFDPASWTVAPFLIALVVAGATCVPAARAMRTDPAQLLQEV